MKIYPKDFHCFGCGAHGDIFTFVMLMDGISFKEAFNELGGDFNNSFSARIKIYQAQKDREKKKKMHQRIQEYREMNYIMMDIWRNLLKREKPLTDEWGSIFNKLQKQEYLWEILNDPKECDKIVREFDEGKYSFF